MPSALLPLGSRLLLRSVLGLTVAVVLLALALPALVDTTWQQITARLSLTSPGLLVLMAVLWLSALYSYTFTLSASLPGLTHGRAMMANAVHAMVGNLVPAGAAVGMAANYAMYRAWGFSRPAVTSSLVVTGVWNVLARVALPVVALLVVAFGPVQAPGRLQLVGAVGAAVGILVLTAFATVVGSDRAAQRVGQVAAALARPLTSRHGPRSSMENLVADLRARTSTVVRGGGIRMTLGLAGMFALLFALYVVAARSVGVDLPLAYLLAAYCFRQLLTIVAVTPGGLGVTEAGTAGMLVLFGGDPAAASAAALLYAAFSQGMTVPLGLGAWLAWDVDRRRRGARPDAD